MVINMDEFQLRTIEQIEQFLNASAEVAYSSVLTTPGATGMTVACCCATCSYQSDQLTTSI
jgi:hypothetical protein